MRPLLLKGHSRSITYVTFNAEGDLLFTSSKDLQVCVWRASTGERLGTYDGHTGAVYHLDVNGESLRVRGGRLRVVWRREWGCAGAPLVLSSLLGAAAAQEPSGVPAGGRWPHLPPPPSHLPHSFPQRPLACC